MPPPIIGQLIVLFLPILTELLQKWLEGLLSSVHREGMDAVELYDAVLATLPRYSLRRRTWRKRALLRRMRAAVADRPLTLADATPRPLTRAERSDLAGLAWPVLADLAA